MKTNTFKMMGLLLCFATATIATSCNRDEIEENRDNTQKIVGTWVCTDCTYANRIGKVVTFEEDGVINDLTGLLIHHTPGTWAIIDSTLIIHSQYETINQWGSNEIVNVKWEYEILQFENAILKIGDGNYSYSDGGGTFSGYIELKKQ